MEMDPLEKITPRSMKNRFCFDPHKIPSGFHGKYYVTEWGYSNYVEKGTSSLFLIFPRKHICCDF